MQSTSTCGDLVVHSDAVREPELTLQIDLYQSSRVSLLGLEERLPVVASGYLAVEQLVDGVTKDPGEPSARRVERLDVLVDLVEFRVYPGRRMP